MAGAVRRPIVTSLQPPLRHRQLSEPGIGQGTTFPRVSLRPGTSADIYRRRNPRTRHAPRNIDMRFGNPARTTPYAKTRLVLHSEDALTRASRAVIAVPREYHPVQPHFLLFT